MRSINLIGDISNSRVWLNLEKRPATLYPYSFISIGKPTYYGTKFGSIIKLGRFVLMGHVRQ